MATHRVAVVVFCEVETELLDDAEVVAPLAIRTALRNQAGDWPADITVDAYGHRFTVRAGRALEVGIAAGNGYLWTRPTTKAYPDERGGA